MARNFADSMNEQTPASPDPRQLARDLKHFMTPRTGRGTWELGSTLAAFLALFTILLFAVGAGYWWALAGTPVAGMLLLRLFIIQHDCGHGSFLPSKAWNDWIGRSLGVLTFTPYDCWRQSHAIHHSATGNLDRRGFGDVDTLTVEEFDQKSATGRLLYRIYRHPLILLGLGPAYLFLLRHRLPIGLMKEGARYWVSAMATNAAIAGIATGLIYAFGVAVVAAVFFPVILTAATVGVYLFYIQHQFDGAKWERKADWSYHEAALGGSSYLHLPQPLRWFTGNIGVHHVHHLASTIPFYRLTEVMREHPGLSEVNRFRVRQSFRALRLALWDEEERRLVTFREAKLRRAQMAAA